ncbi:hypothetical protein [uncultured Pseudokineococcus sp.]|uniref:hypothetical protein n=1 Tax=uncultured Pseudokineococcus sp. TaxID=1642928 RepID=UPI00262932B5|nr:hypothetical protein [uncultured Pseudokineococcus sp.]
MTSPTEPVAAARDRRTTSMSWWPPLLVLTTLVLVALIMSTIGYWFPAFGVMTGCTSEPVPDVDAYCLPAERWLRAGPVGQGALVVAAVVASVVAVRRPSRRLLVLHAGVVGLPVSLAWTVLVTVAASASY